MGKILMLDNYDSFTYNLVQYIEEIIGAEIDVFRNDEISLEDVDNYETIILSPGPGLPNEAGIMVDLIKKYASTKNILGVCLGQQAIGEAFGATLKNLEKVYHGVSSQVEIISHKELLFKGLDLKIEVGRYHSWVIENEHFPSDLEITAVDENAEIMAIRHRKFNVRGVQFHPESIMTPNGKQILRNFLSSTL